MRAKDSKQRMYEDRTHTCRTWHRILVHRFTSTIKVTDLGHPQQRKPRLLSYRCQLCRHRRAASELHAKACIEGLAFDLAAKAGIGTDEADKRCVEQAELETRANLPERADTVCLDIEGLVAV